MCLKIDLMKAFDSVKWSFIESALIALKFPYVVRNWIMQCIQNPSFSVLVNGKAFGFFKSSSGLSQGSPLSPYLFCINYYGNFLCYFRRVCCFSSYSDAFCEREL